MSDRGNQKLAVVSEADETSIKEMIRVWTQQQTVLTIQSFLI